MKERYSNEEPAHLFSQKYDTIQSFSKTTEKESRNFGIQTSPEQHPSVLATYRFNREVQYLKFLKLWFKFSQHRTNSSPQHILSMALYRWRANGLFDESLKSSIKEILEWPFKLEKQGNLPQLDYVRRRLLSQS